MPHALQLPLLCPGVSSPDKGIGRYDCKARRVRESTWLGGCSASRSILVGAVSGALGARSEGALGLPPDWLARLAEPDRMRGLAIKATARCAAP